MIWRRVLVPETYTLRQLHGVFQVAIGWEGIHLFEFNIGSIPTKVPKEPQEFMDSLEGQG